MESMTTTTDPLSPERVKTAIKYSEENRRYASGADLEDAIVFDETIAALARAHLDATKREPPAGLVEVIAGAQDLSLIHI